MQASNMSVNFGIRGNELSPDEVTTALEITPTKSWKRGDIYNSRYKDRDGSIKYRQATRPCGIWELSSVAFTKSTVLEDHAVFIYEKLSPSIDQLEKFIDDNSLRVYINVWWQPDEGYGGYTISANTIRNLSLLCSEIDFSFS